VIARPLFAGADQENVSLALPAVRVRVPIVAGFAPKGQVLPSFARSYRRYERHA
jgi:hypothetical protein